MQASTSRPMHSKTRPKPRDLLVWPSEQGTRSSVCQTTWSGTLTLMRSLVTWGIAKPIKVRHDLVIDWLSVFLNSLAFHFVWIPIRYYAIHLNPSLPFHFLWFLDLHRSFLFLVFPLFFLTNLMIEIIESWVFCVMLPGATTEKDVLERFEGLVGHCFFCMVVLVLVCFSADYPCWWSLLWSQVKKQANQRKRRICLASVILHVHI